MKNISLIVVAILLCFSVCFGQAKKSTKIPTKKKIIAAQKLPDLTLNSLEQEIFNELNILRSSPEVYLSYLEKLKLSFAGNEYTDLDGIRIVSNEGVSVVEDAIKVLKKQKTICLLTLADGLNRAAEQHTKDMSKNDFFGHKGTDGSYSDIRASRFGSWSGSVKENITSGSQKARDIVLQMLVDDGFESRGHRKNLLNPNFRAVGISTVKTPTNGFVCVMVFANYYSEKSTGARML